MSGILRVAVPSPLFQLYDYLPPAGDEDPFEPGMRVKVPFGRTRIVGIVVATAAASQYPADKLRRVGTRLDGVPLLTRELLKVGGWAASYYHHPLGEVLAAMLPAALRKGGEPRIQAVEYWRVTDAGRAADPAVLKRAARQAALLARLQARPEGLARSALEDDGKPALTTLRALAKKGWVERFQTESRRVASLLQDPTSVAPELNAAQAAAVAAINGTDGYKAFLLDGVTGSGKTEVYLRAIAETLAAGKQVLVLVPEIALTPQLIARFRDRLGVANPVAVLHSGLNDTERMDSWLRVARGLAPVVVGTRSAVFTPLARPGLIIVDEEHDPSLKQQDGFRYSARDLAVWRARELDVPVVLGSATPSLESLHNAREGRYASLHLPERAGIALHPEMHLLDLRGKPLHDGLSDGLIERMRAHLEADNQVLLFLNRRGYAPVLQCHDCGWISACTRCDARMTLHQHDRRLRCHHCGHETAVPGHCPDCRSEGLYPVGAGTERLEVALAERFPGSPMVRIDRDATRRKGSLDKLLEQAESGKARILVGTQMLAKGHHFPGVTLVAVVDADLGLFSADFRASERMAQLILQVAGRAGRAERPGEVVIQTHCPDHPLLLKLVRAGYPAFADAALAERKDAGLPPYSHLALLRAEATDENAPIRFLDAAAELARGGGAAWVQFLGPVPAPMARRAGRWRAQAMLRAESRSPLQRLLGEIVPKLDALPEARKVRWSVDVDPADTY